MNEREQLEQAIAALEAQRAILGDAVVNAALAPMREKLAALSAPAARETQQRKQVTVLFADVSGFTAMSETMDPEEVSATMNALWARLDAAITNHGGWIDKHIGDAVMALFGVPAAQEDDPERAVRAALAMQAELAAFEAPSPLRMRIGLNTGPVLLGAVGTTGEYTAMGDTVNLASRLEHAAPVGGILISHDTYRHIRGVFDVLPQSPLTVKGKAEPIRTYVVRAAKERTFRVTTRGVEGIETRTIGREAELQQLQAARTAARDERKTHLVNVVAEAGVGKSRLLYEFSNWLEMLPERTWLFRGRATQEMMKLPYALIRDVLASRFDIRDSDRAAVARDKLEQGIADVVTAGEADSRMWAHFIGHLIGFDFSDSPYLEGILDDARQIRDRAFHYLAEFFAHMTREHVGVMLLEDMHWADEGSLDLVDHLARERPDLPLLIIGPTRPTLFERRPAWGDGLRAYIRLDLQPLSDADSRRLVAEILRNVPEIPSALTDLIVSRAEGNSFYVEELIKMLIEDDVIVIGEDVWRVEMKRLAQVRIPATLTGVLQSRLDGLPMLEREKLQQASVVGRVFWENVLEHLRNPEARAADSPAAVSEGLSHLCHKELIFRHETSAFAEAREYIFKHALLHEVTYESVLKRLRRAYHAQVADYLVEVSGERTGEYAGRIGEHYERAGQWAKAAEWYGRAGKQAKDTYSPVTAIDYYQKALKFWKDSGTEPAQQLEVYEGLGDVLVMQARYPEAIAVYTEMLQAATSTGELAAQARAGCGLAMAQAGQGDHRAALESAVQAEATAREAEARRELALALSVKSQCLFRLGNNEAALELGQQMLALAHEIDEPLLTARGLNLLGIVHNVMGRYAQAELCWEDGLLVCQASGDRRQMMSLLNNLGVIAWAHGDYKDAQARFYEALNIAREIGHRDGEMVFLNNVGATRVVIGDYRAAEADLRQVIRMVGESGASVLSESYSYLAEACLGQDKVEEALITARRALTLGREAGVQEYIVAAWRVLGMVAAQLPEPISISEKAEEAHSRYSAEDCFTESARLCTDNGLEGERARTLRAWARYELEQADAQKGAALWQEAREIFTRLGAELEVERMAALPTRVH